MLFPPDSHFGCTYCRPLTRPGPSTCQYRKLQNRKGWHLRADDCGGKNCGVPARAGNGLLCRVVFEVARLHHVLALEPHVGNSMGEGAQPHAVNFSKINEDLEIVDPPRWALHRAALDAMDVVSFRVHPDL